MPSLDNHQSNSFTKLTAANVAAHFNRPIVVNEQGCWLWLGSTDKRGYARFGGHLLVYGFTFRAAGFKCETGQELCHTCLNKNCVNPHHLYAGTHKQNMEDASRAGVMGLGSRKVTDEQIQLAIKMLDEGCTQRQICKVLGVSEAWFTKFKNGGLQYAKLV